MAGLLPVSEMLPVSAEDAAALLAVEHLDSICFELSLPRVKEFDERSVQRSLRTIKGLAKGSEGDIAGATGREVRAAAAARDSTSALVQLMSPRSFTLATRKSAVQVLDSVIS